MTSPLSLSFMVILLEVCAVQHSRSAMSAGCRPPWTPPVGYAKVESIVLVSGAQPERTALTSTCDPEIDYPTKAVLARLQGLVILRGTISPLGKPHVTSVVKSVNPYLDYAALDGVESLELRDVGGGIPASGVFEARVRFELRVK